jgi:membrane-associated phospholipid phosphatase
VLARLKDKAPGGVRIALPTNAAWGLPAAGLCVIGLAMTWIVADLVPITHVQDAVALHDFTELGRPRVDVLSNDLLRLLDPLGYTLWGIALVALALIRRRPRVALAVALVLPMAPLSAEILKPLLAHSHVQIGWKDMTQASWPSGHSTAAMSLALCAVLVAPSHMRTAVAMFGSMFAVAVGFSLLILAWHMPSDVFGGYLLAALWSTLAVAGLHAAEKRWPSPIHQHAVRTSGPRKAFTSAQETLIAALVAAIVTMAVVTAAILGGDHIETFAFDHRTLMVAATGIAALAVLISSALTAGLRR